MANLDSDLLASVEQAFASSGKTEIYAEKRGWRYEVTGEGKYWQWRKGSGSDRRSIYGGTFDTLPAERKEKYHGNKQSKARAKTSRTTDGA